MDNFIRWQATTIKQFGFLTNLILGLSIGLLAYNFKFILPNDIQLNCLQKTLFWISVIFILITVLIALIISINRLKDFRLTAKIARMEEKKITKNIDLYRENSKKMGKKTWCLFNFLVFTFFIGFLTSAIYIMIELSDKLT